MGTITNMQVAAFTLGLLGIVSSLLVLMDPRPQVLDRMNSTPSQDRDFHSNKTGLQRLLSLDGGFSETVDESFGFRISVLFTNIVHIFAHANLLYGAIQPTNGIEAYAIYQIITNLLILTYHFLAVWFVPPYEYFHFAMCLFPMECVPILYLWPIEFVPILYALSVTLALCVFFTRTFLVCYILKVETNKMDGDKVSVISV